MAHHTVKSGYSQLVERLNRFPQGAPPSPLLKKILNILFSEQEAELVSLLPIKPFTVKQAAANWKMTESDARKILQELAGRAILVDIEQNGEQVYALPPPMAGFFEFSMMRIRNDVDQKVLSELFYQYLNEEDAFILDLFTEGETRLGRTFVHEPALTDDNALRVLDYERATHVIESATDMGVGMCYCRHKMAHLGKACDAPMDICMTFNNTATSLIKHGHARRVDKKEGMDLLQLAYEHNLVQFGENVQKRVNFICNCCGCCCEALLAAKRFAVLNPVHTTNFIPEINSEKCNGCGKCEKICPVDAIKMVEENGSGKVAQLQEDLCLGCGVCVRNCPKDAIALTSREQRVITPVNGVHKVVMMAIERDKLQHLIFNNQVLFSHRALAAVLGAIFKLPPVKQILASQQVKSRYMAAMIDKLGYA